MYSGLISEVGLVRTAPLTEEGILLTIEAPGIAARLKPGGSFSVNGVSLTPETMRRTTLALLKEGDEVNIETDIVPKYLRRFNHPPPPSLAWAGLRHGPEAVEMAITTIAAGGKVIVWDPSREGEGDVI